LTLEDRELVPLAICADYEGLHAALRERVAQLAVRLDSVDDAALVADRQTSKLLSLVPKKSVLGALTLGSILQALGVCIVIAEDRRSRAYMEAKLADGTLARRNQKFVGGGRGPRPTTLRECMALSYVRKALEAEGLLEPAQALLDRQWGKREDRAA
jgi:hypothetical protein